MSGGGPASVFLLCRVREAPGGPLTAFTEATGRVHAFFKPGFVVRDSFSAGLFLACGVSLLEAADLRWSSASGCVVVEWLRVWEFFGKFFSGMSVMAPGGGRAWAFVAWFLREVAGSGQILWRGLGRFACF